jgi:hypothetical protein
MVTLDELVCQYRVPINNAVLDSALRRMFPGIPDDACRFLRRPLRRWHAAVVKLLSSQQDTLNGLVFVNAHFRIFISCPTNRRGWVEAMFMGLRREIDAALTRLPADCPRQFSCALLDTLKNLFGKSVLTAARVEPLGKRCASDWIGGH